MSTEKKVKMALDFTNEAVGCAASLMGKVGPYEGAMLSLLSAIAMNVTAVNFNLDRLVKGMEE